jgi:hypothetical protein
MGHLIGKNWDLTTTKKSCFQTTKQGDITRK